MDIQHNIEEMASNYLEKNGWNEWAKYVLMSLEDLKKQTLEQDHKIEANKESSLQAINSLEVTVVKGMSDLSGEIKVIKKQITMRAVAWSSVIPGITAAVLLVLKLINHG